jgi:hypothetical protein
MGEGSGNHKYLFRIEGEKAESGGLNGRRFWNGGIKLVPRTI